MKEAYEQQVLLLLEVLPEVAKEKCFALHGGTAINLFVRDMPRLSVDIDLTYISIEEREISLQNINQSLLRTKERIDALKPQVNVMHRNEVCKLNISDRGVQVKVEVNMVIRGLLGEPIKSPLCMQAQNQFDVFCSIDLVPFGQLYGGKICAAVDRQHPRDLFDVKMLLDNEGFSEEIKQGFLLSLLSSDRPIHELFNPSMVDQQQAFEHHFEGMTNEPFSYMEFEHTRSNLVGTIKQNLTKQDKAFLLGVNRVEPDWSDYDFERFPAVQWKLQNLEKLKANNPNKFSEQCDALEAALLTE